MAARVADPVLAWARIQLLDGSAPHPGFFLFCRVGFGSVLLILFDPNPDTGLVFSQIHFFSEGSYFLFYYSNVIRLYSGSEDG